MKQWIVSITVTHLSPYHLHLQYPSQGPATMMQGQKHQEAQQALEYQDSIINIGEEKDLEKTVKKEDLPLSKRRFNVITNQEA